MARKYARLALRHYLEREYVPMLTKLGVALRLRPRWVTRRIRRIMRLW